jgi:nitrite reductase (NO-forming)
MKNKLIPFSLIITSFSILLLSSGCNVQGFFTKYEDDPVYTAPYSQTAANASASGTDAASASPGAQVFTSICSSCHQAKGQGVPGTYPPLAGSAIAQDADATKPIRLVLHGFKGQIERNGKTYNGVMSSWKQLSDQEIADALTYVRSSWGNSAGAVTPDEVKSVRDKTTGRSGAYEEAELQQAL